MCQHENSKYSSVGAMYCPNCYKPVSLQSPCDCQLGGKAIEWQDYEVPTTESPYKAKDKCPGKSQSPCPNCGKCLGIFEDCGCMPVHVPIGIDTTILGTGTIKAKPLEELYEELGKLKWLGENEGWNAAIEAVRKHLASQI